jgi:ABC-2 type transport system ATP-binding protein
LLYLDEPTAGVDALGRKSLVDIVRAQAAAGVAVVLTTHLIADVEDLADRVIVLARGRVRSEGTLDELTGTAAAVRFTAVADLPLSDLMNLLGPSYRVAEVNAGAYVVEGDVTPHVLAHITTWCADQGVLPRGLTTGRHSLLDLLAESAGNDEQGEER